VHRGGSDHRQSSGPEIWPAFSAAGMSASTTVGPATSTANTIKVVAHPQPSDRWGGGTRSRPASVKIVWGSGTCVGTTSERTCGGQRAHEDGRTGALDGEFVKVPR
jgi:hypothetical protein